MTIREQFLEILRVLSEPPPPAGQKPPFAEKGHTSEADSDKSDKPSSETQRQGTGV